MPDARLRHSKALTLRRRRLEPHRYALRGNLDAARGTPEWRKAARAIAEAELQVLARMYDRDEGVPAHEMAHPLHLASAGSGY